MKVIVFGATGNLGREICKAAVAAGHHVTAVVRNEGRAAVLAGIQLSTAMADVTDRASLAGICKGFDAVISALGKSVSPNDKSKTTFNTVDFAANSYILGEAQSSGVGKFVYVSALHSERYQHLEYFRVHHAFSELLKWSGVNYSIIKPPAIFSAFGDMMQMAAKGQLVNIGSGDKKTNPIYEGDLARICVGSLGKENVTIEAGGQTIYTRKALNDIIQGIVAPQKKVRVVPLGMFKMALPFIKLFDRNSYDKFAFFAEVIQHDTIAPQVGPMKFEDYIKIRAEKAK